MLRKKKCLYSFNWKTDSFRVLSFGLKEKKILKPAPVFPVKGNSGLWDLRGSRLSLARIEPRFLTRSCLYIGNACGLMICEVATNVSPVFLFTGFVAHNLTPRILFSGSYKTLIIPFPVVKKIWFNFACHKHLITLLIKFKKNKIKLRKKNWS